MASSLNTPDVLTQPIAENGTKNSIPNTNDQSLGLVSQSTGFPAICSERIADGGKAPRRADFNGVFNLLSRYMFFKQNGGVETFRSDVSTAIGGYPLNAILSYKNGSDVKFVRSMIANNTYNFVSTPSYIDDGVHWETVIPSMSWINSHLANVDMSNLTSIGKNIANWSTNTTNCITEIPQDLKLELNAGTLTLKAGSKVYVPNGSGVFNTVTIANDLTTTRTDNQDCMVWYNSGDGTIQLFPKSLFYSGVTAPTQYQFMFWYDTTNNQCKVTGDQGVTWATGHSFPLAIVETDGTQISAIKQVFNGFGYVGSTVFALPGVKGLMPNGRNADGTLNSTSVTSTTVVTATDNTAGQRCVYFQGNTIAITNTTTFTYNEADNYYYYGNNIGYLTMVDTNMTIDSNGKIASFTPKTAFHAVDYNDISTLLGMIYPVGSIYIGTQASCPLATLIPGSTWTQIQGRYLLASGTLDGTSETYSATNTVAAGLPGITGSWENYGAHASAGAGAVSVTTRTRGNRDSGDGQDSGQYTFDASRSSSVYGQSTTTRAPAYVVNVWRRDS